jgi:hypothetical protein
MHCAGIGGISPSVRCCAPRRNFSLYAIAFSTLFFATCCVWMVFPFRNIPRTSMAVASYTVEEASPVFASRGGAAVRRCARSGRQRFQQGYVALFGTALPSVAYYMPTTRAGAMRFIEALAVRQGFDGVRFSMRRCRPSPPRPLCFHQGCASSSAGTTTRLLVCTSRCGAAVCRLLLLALGASTTAALRQGRVATTTRRRQWAPFVAALPSVAYYMPTTRARALRPVEARAAPLNAPLRRERLN